MRPKRTAISASLRLIDHNGGKYLRIDQVNPAHTDIGPLLSTAAAIADILEIPAIVIGEPRHQAVAQAERITTQLTCFEAAVRVTCVSRHFYRRGRSAAMIQRVASLGLEPL